MNPGASPVEGLGDLAGFKPEGDFPKRIVYPNKEVFFRGFGRPCCRLQRTSKVLKGQPNEGQRIQKPCAQVEVALLGRTDLASRKPNEGQRIQNSCAPFNRGILLLASLEASTVCFLQHHEEKMYISSYTRRKRDSLVTNESHSRQNKRFSKRNHDPKNKAEPRLQRKKRKKPL